MPGFVLRRALRHPRSAARGLLAGFHELADRLPQRDRALWFARHHGVAVDWFDFVVGWPLRQSTRRAYILDTLWSD